MSSTAGTTLGPLALRYTTGRIKRGEIVQTTRTQYHSVLYRFAAVHGRRPLEQLGTRTVERWLETFEGKAVTTRRSAFTIVKGFTAWLARERLIAVDPCVGMKAPRKPHVVPRNIEPTDIGKLLAVAPDARARAIICVEVGMGLRRVEVHRLRVEHWSRRDQAMRITGKGSHERLVPVPDFVRRALEDYLSECPATSGPLFRPVVAGVVRSRSLSLSALSHYMATWMYEAGIKRSARDGVNSHALRHSAATDVLEACGDIRVVQAMLGHANVATTSIYLGRPDLTKMRQAMEGRDYRSQAESRA